MAGSILEMQNPSQYQFRQLNVEHALICVVSLAVTQAVTQKITGDDQFYYQHRWLFLVAMLFAAALTYGLHRMLLRRKESVVIDKESGEEIALRSNDSLFFIPVRIWPAILVVLGIMAAVVGPKAGAQPGAATHESQPMLSE
jgi:hypothetical protein